MLDSRLDCLTCAATQIAPQTSDNKLGVVFQMDPRPGYTDLANEKVLQLVHLAILGQQLLVQLRGRPPRLEQRVERLE